MKDSRQSFGWGCALIVALTIVAYLPALRGGFVWDDDQYVTHNLTLRNAEGLRQIWLNPAATFQYYPLTFTSLWLEYHLWGLHPFGFHMVNVLLHAANAVLLWRLLTRLSVPGAWWAAAIFAVHPVTVESVAWTIERKNVLSCLFYFLAALAYLRFRPLATGEAGDARDWRVYPLVLVLFLCALLSKAVTSSLPAALALLVWWKTGRLGKRDVLELIPLFVLGVALGLMSVWMEKHYVGAGGAEWTYSFVQRCLLAGRVLWFYAGKLVWPRNLTFIYPRWEIDAGAAWSYLFPLAAIGVVIALWKLRSRIGKGPLVAVLFFAGTLVPVLGFFDVYPFRFSFVADHFQYPACVGLMALAGSTGATIAQRAGQQGRRLGTLAAGVVLLVLGVSTWKQTQIYHDVETLWRDTLAKNPNAWLAHNNLGGYLQDSGKLTEAIEHYEEALRLKPDYPEAQGNWGMALVRLGRAREAIAHCEEALRLKPDSILAQSNLGRALLQAGTAKDAIPHFEQVLRMLPGYPEGQFNLALALEQTGRLPEAIGHYEKALRLKPDSVEVQNNLAWLLATLAPADGGNPARAVTLAQRACDQSESVGPAHLDTLAAAYAAAGRFAEAIATAQKALDLARAAEQPQIAKEIETRLELYRSGRAYRR